MTLCATYNDSTDQVFVLTSLDFFGTLFSLISEHFFAFCSPNISPSCVDLKTDTETGVMFYRTKKNESETLLLQA